MQTQTGPAARGNRAGPHDEFVPISLATLGIVGDFALDLFIDDGQPSGPMLYCASNVALTRRDIEALEYRGIRALFIRAGALDQYQAVLNAALDDALADPDTPTVERVSILQDTAAPLLSAALRRVNAGEVVVAARQVSTQLSGLLATGEAMPGQIVDLLRHDYYTYTHMINVATYATLLALELGISDRGQLASITTGAMLHDLGKRRVPGELLRKTTPLTPAEEHVLRMHPIYGFEDLRSEGADDWGILMMVYQHHERHDGSGYPVGLARGDIHPYASICMIADVFDAMTCTRPYRARLSKSTAASFLLRHAGMHFDREMVECWLGALRKTCDFAA